MDSLTQAVLGASIAGVCAPSGQRRKALLVGAALGTLPDLDVVIDYGDPVANFTRHRGFSHSLLVLAPFSILLWLALRRWWAPVRAAPLRWLAAIALVLLTHPLLDANTAYGTQLFWPFSPPPTMWAVLFIIDPLYTLPLLAGTLLAAFWPRRPWAGHVLITGVALSTSYLCWAWTAQSIVEAHARESLAAARQQDASIFLTPTPLNTLLWRVVVLSSDGYYEGFDSLLLDEGPMRFDFYESNNEALHAASNVGAVARLRWFSHDFLKARVVDDTLILDDLRMGQEPSYVFTHSVAIRGNPHWQAIPPERLSISLDERMLGQTWQRIWRQ
ncbi:MAG: metal-dependent hydrolase [Gammaproteobacteria bacterium]|nr:metal-dependent hydrolase [Gammaproteobacteria bacterium]